jgi:hypothetical protein
MRSFAVMLVMFIAPVILAQQNPAPVEKRVALNETAVALDANGMSALEATLSTSALNGSPDAPVTNTRLVVKNSGVVSYALVSGVVTFYDAAGVRCGEGVFKADVLAPNESFETDTPGIRVRCAPTSWRVVATNLIPKTVLPPVPTAARLVITVDGEEHPIQLEKPITLNLGNKRSTIVVREVP